MTAITAYLLKARGAYKCPGGIITSFLVMTDIRHRARESQGGPTRDRKLAALDRALACGHPTADVKDMLA